MPTPSPAVKRIVQRRQAKRDSLWTDAADVVFLPANGGWSRIPRTVPMIASLVDELGGRDNAGRLYITLWAYELGDGFVEVPDPAQLALEAGYVTNRAERTFNERIVVLRELGFVRTARLGLREHGFVLLLDPHRVIARMHNASPERIPERWWTAFVARCGTIGIVLEPEAAAPQTPEDIKVPEDIAPALPPVLRVPKLKAQAPAAPSAMPKRFVPVKKLKVPTAKRAGA